MKNNLKIGKRYCYGFDNILESEKDFVFYAKELYCESNDLDENFLKKHCTFDSDGECNFDYDMNKDEVWKDFRDMHQIINEIEKIKNNSFVLEIKNENDLSEIYYNNKCLTEMNVNDFNYLQMYFDVRHNRYDIYIENSDIDSATVYTIMLNNGEVNAILFEEENDTGTIYKINDLIDYLNENHPERDELNFISHSLNPQSNDVKLLMMNLKDSDNRVDSNNFLIGKEAYEQFVDGSRRLEDVSVYDEKLNEIRNNSDVADLHNTIVLDYQKTQENKLTQDKMQSLVDRHSPTTNEPKQDVRKSLRNKM
ncbi:TPA: hypothetical protein NGW16_004219 [Vibrio parahaemolyticus]|nr:hypothetical protein [Vibrio cholerae]HCE4999483.1 hypothetical protein [Vibrio parahaemolyticus]